MSHALSAMPSEEAHVLQWQWSCDADVMHLAWECFEVPLKGQVLDFIQALKAAEMR